MMSPFAVCVSQVLDRAEKRNLTRQGLGAVSSILWALRSQTFYIVETANR